MEATNHTFYAADVPRPPEAPKGEPSGAQRAAKTLVRHARGLMSDEEKDALEALDDDGRLDLALARVLESLDKDPTNMGSRGDITDLIATRCEMSPFDDRFLVSPIDGGVLMADTAGDLVSMQGAQVQKIATGAEHAGEQYIAGYLTVDVLTGPNKGKTYAARTYPVVVPHRRIVSNRLVG